jgi:hypothetical protein
MELGVSALNPRRAVVEEHLVEHPSIGRRGHGPDQRGRAHPLNGRLDQLSHGSIPSRVTREGVLRPHSQIGWVPDQALVEGNMVQGHLFGLKKPVRGQLARDVSLNDRHVHGGARRRREHDHRRQTHGGQSAHNAHGRGARGRPEVSENGNNQGVHQHDHEGDAPHSGQRGQRQQQVVPVLGVGQGPPREPAHGPHTPHPIEDRPRRRQPHGGPQGPSRPVAAPPDQDRSHHSKHRGEGGLVDHQRQPRDHAERDEPPQEQAEVREAEGESNRRSPPRPRATQPPQHRNQGHERQRADVGRRVRKEQQEARGDRRQDGDQGSVRPGQTQSRQYMRFLSASWLRMGLTR